MAQPNGWQANENKENHEKRMETSSSQTTRQEPTTRKDPREMLRALRSRILKSTRVHVTSRGLVVVEGDSIAKAGLEVVLVEATGNQAAAHRG